MSSNERCDAIMALIDEVLDHVTANLTADFDAKTADDYPWELHANDFLRA